ncbi:MAG: hypothetical protein ACK4L8_00055 [Nitrincola lacisaponensis]|uniref:hypothetical protein n=1 Tax=Nitrincola lacisaponensis TaxID=267850 RepID=UPI00391A5B1F
MVTPENFMEQANYLMELASSEGDSQSEMHLRTAVSRAYYSAFHAAKRIANTCPAPENHIAGSHMYIIRQLIDCPPASHTRQTVKSIKKIGLMLNQAKDHRTHADYDLTDIFPGHTATSQLQITNKIIRFCDRVTQDIYGDS